MLYSLETCFPNCGRSLSASQLGCQLFARLAASLSSPFCCPTPSLWKARSALGEGPGGLREMCLASLSHLRLWSARVVHQMIWGSPERGSQLFCSPSNPQDLCFPLTEEIFSLPGPLLRLQRPVALTHQRPTELQLDSLSSCSVPGFCILPSGVGEVCGELVGGMYGLGVPGILILLPSYLLLLTFSKKFGWFLLPCKGWKQL